MTPVLVVQVRNLKNVVEGIKMGTRGSFGFIINGEKKIAYNHFDSYPSGLGQDILEQLVEIGDLEILKKAVAEIEMVDEDSEPTDEQREYCNNHNTADPNVNRGEGWYSLLRRHQGMITPYVDGFKYMLDGEWAFNAEEYDYLIDFDNNKFEFYAYRELIDVLDLNKVMELEKPMIKNIINEWEDRDDE